MGSERITVFIAGNIHVKRALVRRFLEDDGYAVLGEARTAEEMVAGARREPPDAIVVDDELLAAGPGGGTIGRLRRAAPDARIVVFTDAAVEGDGPLEGADAYLEKGLGLASLTALLGRLFTPDAATPNDATDDEAARAPASREPAASTSRPPVAGRVAAIAVGAIAVVWGIGAMIANRGEPATRPVDRTDAAASVAPKPSPSASTALDAAYATVDDMIGALRAGNYVLATVDARSLLEQRDAARAAGFALTGLDAELMARLVGLAEDVPPRVAAQLEDILGELYPAEPAPPDRPGGGTGVILGPGTSNDATPTTVGTPSATTAGGSTGAAHTGNGGNQGGGGNGGGSGGGNHPGGAGGDPGGGGSGEGDGGGGTPPPEDEGDGGVTTPDDGAVGPGDGRAWGQSHRPDGGWHGEHNDERTAPGKPPWAGGPPSS